MDKVYLRRALGYFLASLLAVALILYIGYHISRFLRKEVATVPAQEVEQTFYARCDGYIFRREETIPAASGTGTASVADGTHVHVGEEVAVIYSGSDPVAEANISSARRQLSLLKDYDATNRGAKDAASADARIYSLLTRMKALGAKNDLTGVCEMRPELIAHLNERAVASGTSSGSFGELISALEASITAEKAKLGSVLATVSAPRTGWYYAAADGFESAFNPDLLGAMTVPEFDALTATAPASTEGTAGKLVLDYRWNLALKMSPSDAAHMHEGESCPVSFAYNGGVSLPMTVDRIVPDSASGTVLVIMSSGNIPPGFSFTRCQTVDVTTETVTGFYVPLSAARLVDGVLGVYIFDGVYANFRRIDVLRESDDGYIVKTDATVAAEKEAAQTAAADSGEAAVTEGTDTAQSAGGSDTERPFSAAGAPYLAQNDLIVVEGKDLYEGKIIS